MPAASPQPANIASWWSACLKFTLSAPSSVQGLRLALSRGKHVPWEVMLLGQLQVTQRGEGLPLKHLGRDLGLLTLAPVTQLVSSNRETGRGREGDPGQISFAVVSGGDGLSSERPWWAAWGPVGVGGGSHGSKEGEARAKNHPPSVASGPFRERTDSFFRKDGLVACNSQVV